METARTTRENLRTILIVVVPGIVVITLMAWGLKVAGIIGQGPPC